MTLDARAASQARGLRPRPSAQQIENRLAAVEIRKVIYAVMAERTETGLITRTGRAFRAEWHRYETLNLRARRSYKVRVGLMARFAEERRAAAAA